jgi:hypothetical protein
MYAFAVKLAARVLVVVSLTGGGAFRRAGDALVRLPWTAFHESGFSATARFSDSDFLGLWWFEGGFIDGNA